MNLVDFVYNTLKSVKCPATHQVRPSELPGLSFHFFGHRPSLHGDGDPVREECNCQIDIWTRNGMSHLIERKVRRVMKKAGFLYVREDDNFEESIGIYQKTIVFYKEFGVED